MLRFLLGDRLEYASRVRVAFVQVLSERGVDAGVLLLGRYRNGENFPLR